MRSFIAGCIAAVVFAAIGAVTLRSEEHTSELQSQSNLVCRLLLEKKKYHNHALLLRGEGGKSSLKGSVPPGAGYSHLGAHSSLSTAVSSVVPRHSVIRMRRSRVE